MNKFLNQIFRTKIGWLIICLLFTGVFVVLSNYYDWAEYGIYISLIYPVILLLILIAYGWIINPIREYKQNKKLRDGNK